MRGRRSGSRTGTFLVLAGIAGVLGVTFIAGVWTGHNWPVLIGNPKAPGASEPAVARRAAGERPRPAETLPALTFYHELTAPLTAPPPPRKPPRPARPPEPKRAEPARTEEASPAPSAPTPPPRAELPAAASPDTRFTIQVAAYNARALAEALRSTLAAAGHEARVVETASGTSVRYRVQVGTFTTREAAREAAGRLAAQRSLSTFVTTR